MTDEQPTDLLAALPRTRPHRRSPRRGELRRAPAADGQRSAGSNPREPRAKPARQGAPGKPSPARGAKSARASAPRLRQPAQPSGTPAAARPALPEDRKIPPTPADILGTAVGAAAELAEIGLTLGSRAVRRALSRLPRP